MHNVGAIFRIADAFLIEKIYLCGITAIPPHREIHKTALGAEEIVNWEYSKDTMQLLKQLKQKGYTITLVEQTDNGSALHELHPVVDHKYCIVFGHEVFGVSDATLSLGDLCVEIPQYGTKHSLNVAVSAGIVVWELFKKLTFKH